MNPQFLQQNPNMIVVPIPVDPFPQGPQGRLPYAVAVVLPQTPPLYAPAVSYQAAVNQLMVNAEAYQGQQHPVYDVLTVSDFRADIMRIHFHVTRLNAPDMSLVPTVIFRVRGHGTRRELFQAVEEWMGALQVFPTLPRDEWRVHYLETHAEYSMLRACMQQAWVHTAP
jgi:hypothetical protein